MSKKKQHSNDIPFANSLCRDVGHQWQSTLSTTYRTCTRSHCKAAQQLVNGQWGDVQATSHKQAAGQRSELTTMLWATHPDASPGLQDRSSAEQQQAERAYYRLLGR
jgi:hypothetical protein